MIDTSMEFACKRCGYKTRYKQALVNHLMRKNTCNATEQDVAPTKLIEELQGEKKAYHYSCKYCKKTFTTNQSRCRHQHSCIEKSKASEIDTLKDRVAFLEQQLTTISNTSINIIHNTTNIGQQNINIQINNFGSETYNHLTDEFITRCLQNEVGGVKDLIEKIHFSDEVPENKNVRLKSIKNRLVEIANNESWVVQDAAEAMDTMIKKGKRLLERQYYESDIYQQELENLDMRIQDFLASIVDKDSQHYHALRRRIFALIIDQSHL